MLVLDEYVRGGGVVVVFHEDLFQSAFSKVQVQSLWFISPCLLLLRCQVVLMVGKEKQNTKTEAARSE